ncbi:MAG: Oxysterol-binding protein-domain-containing protein, partial [Olpidium bornovanus]
GELHWRSERPHLPVVPALHDESDGVQTPKEEGEFLDRLRAALSAGRCWPGRFSAASLLGHPDRSLRSPILTNFLPPCEARIVAVLKWFVSTLYGSYYSRCAKGFEKKPYNPVLGEEFFCNFKCDKPCGKTRLFCEQGNLITTAGRCREAKHADPSLLTSRTQNFLTCGIYRFRPDHHAVSHHPPITAFYIENLEDGVYLNGHCGC